MKKYLNPKYLPIAVTVAGVVGFLLRMWTQSGGVNSEGLYAPAPLAWALLWVLTAAVFGLIILLTRPLSEPVKYEMNFPASPAAAAGTALGALAILVSGIQSMFGSQELLSFVSGLLGIVGGILLLFVANARLRGTKANFLHHGVVCLFFALRVFNQCRGWGNEPQLSLFLFDLLFQLCAMLAVYHLCAFDVDLGNRRVSLFWSLMSVYLCLVALASTGDMLLYGGVAIWLLTNLCSLRPVKKRRPTSAKTPDPVQAQISGSDMSIEEIKNWLEDQQ